MDKLPVYIISFRGMTFYGNVKPGSNAEPPVHHEFNVVVDATTGVVLLAFSNQ